MDLLRQYQADIMLILSSICGVMLLLVYLTNTISEKRKLALMQIELSAMLLMISDRRAYIYRGDTSSLGWWMVRISNFLVFFLTLVVIYFFNSYLIDLYTHEGGLKSVPRRLKVVKILALMGMAMVVLSQFTGFYYTFDEMNRYQRAPGFIVCYVIPLTILLLQLSVILRHYGKLRRGMRSSLVLFALLSLAASILQVFMYGVSLTNMTIAAMSALLYIFALTDMGLELQNARNREIDFYIEEQKNAHALFEQTAESLAAAIDAKDKYTHGHSARVALYSQKIAREAGKSDEECEQVYFAALLHDVGKIGVPDSIINKDGKLSNEEFAQIKMHPVYGNQILASIQQSPYLSIGAHYHHERYDGHGYPDGLKGEDIPDIARIISVADSYDAMTSKRSYRDPIPQQKVREELVKGMGTQFDPTYAKIMLHLIDLDSEYAMRENETGTGDKLAPRIECKSIYHDCSMGIIITDQTARIYINSRPEEGFSEDTSIPTLLLFDSLDGRVHLPENEQKDLLYFEYCQIRADGETLRKGARKIQTQLVPMEYQTERTTGMNYVIEAVRIKDHVRIRIAGRGKRVECVVALPDSVRFAYLSLTGSHCVISNIFLNRDKQHADADEIPRIAEEISYIRDCPEGDLPNIQINGWCADATAGIPIENELKLSFHSQSLPTAHLVWHCPYIRLFTSENGQVDGEAFQEYLLLRLDGEDWQSDKHVDNTIQIDHTRQFPGWNEWKEKNRQGLDCTISIKREGNCIRMETVNLGIAIYSTTTIKDEVDSIYVALTGDQCALTDIRILPVSP